MRRAITIRLCFFAVLWFAAPAIRAQTVVDRIAARVEDDILLLSEERELGLYQQLVNGRAEDRDALLKELIEQWIVKTEIAAAQYPAPSVAEIDQALKGLEKQHISFEAFQTRLREIGLPLAAIRRLLAQQIQMSHYLEYKFRPAAQVDSEQIEKYYKEEFAPKFQARGQAPPALEAVREQIHELLVQRDISERAAHWLDESRARLKVEILLGPAAKGKKP
jgi:DNA-binding transcriptional MerR regulator